MKTLLTHTLILLILSGMAATATAQNKRTAFRITILNTLGEPQAGMVLKITGYSQEHTSDSSGVIRFEHDVNKNYTRMANFYFPSDKTRPVKTLKLNEALADTLLYIDSPENLAQMKQSGRLFPIEGIVKHDGTPLAGAEIQIQGTGRKATTDTQGRFCIEADYSHLIVVRAEGMETHYSEIRPFLTHAGRPYEVNMRAKGSDRIYTTVEQMPEYPGGMKAFFNYIERKLRPSHLAEETDTEGVTVIQFVVEKDGRITSPSIVRPLQASLDTAALEVIQTMPRWRAGKEKSVNVRCKYSVPIRFKKPLPEPPMSPADSLRMIARAQQADSISKLPPAAIRGRLTQHAEIPVPTFSAAEGIRLEYRKLPYVELKEKKRGFFRRLFGRKD